MMQNSRLWISSFSLCKIISETPSHHDPMFSYYALLKHFISVTALWKIFRFPGDKPTSADSSPRPDDIMRAKLTGGVSTDERLRIISSSLPVEIMFRSCDEGRKGVGDLRGTSFLGSLSRNSCGTSPPALITSTKAFSQE